MPLNTLRTADAIVPARRNASYIHPLPKKTKIARAELSARCVEHTTRELWTSPAAGRLAIA